jgi:hypothetical protein
MALRCCLTILSIYISGLSAEASQSFDFAPAGRHYPLFKFEKNFNPQNILIAYTRLDSQCRFIEKDPARILDFYWLKDGSERKDAHPLIKKNIRDRLESVRAEPRVGESAATAFQLKDTKALNGSMSSVRMEIDVKVENGGCDVETTARYKVGQKTEAVVVEEIKADTTRTFLPPFHKVQTITFIGKNLETGKPVTQVFKR